jgi:hypothetical protein
MDKILDDPRMVVRLVCLIIAGVGLSLDRDGWGWFLLAAVLV